MAEPSTFRGTLDFFGELGIFDVVLPFLLVFTIVFAILEKTRVFGTEKVGTEEMTKKNLNAITAFVIAFFTIASSRIVAIITDVSANVVILLLASVFFLLLVGSFYQQKTEGFFLEGGVRTLFVVIMFIGLLLIFLNAIKSGDKSWLMWILHWLGNIATERGVAAVVLLIFVVLVIVWITRTPKPEKKS
ncbi:hypothetical protein JXB11_00585 [Candidatus Woesearchaeota archaeon]|nr:hypothetical protein [Candidatus Woesearchaeota archaeon]